MNLKTAGREASAIPESVATGLQADRTTRRAYGVRDFCEAFGVSRSTVYNLFAAGTLRSVRIAGRRIIPADAAEALLKGEV